MNQAEFTELLSPEVQAWILEHREADPQQLALRGAPKGFPIAAACRQIALLQKAKHKLPSWYAANCILPQRAYEQCSSEAVASAKPWKSGNRALDLTCGLGVDSWAIAQHYATVESCEPNLELAAVVAHNTQQLGQHNQNIHQITAEAWLNAYQGTIFDLIYIDPDRRDQHGKRAYALADCQPNVLDLLPQLQKNAHRILIKASPMLDIAALRNDLHNLAMIWVVSEAGECKELLAEIGHEIDPKTTGAIFIRKGQTHYFQGIAGQAPTKFAAISNYLYEADTALYKADLAATWFESDQNALKGAMTSKQGYFSSESDDPNFHGHRFKVLEVFPWKPELIRKALKAKGIKKIQISRRDFDLSMQTIHQQLKIQEGGKLFLLLTEIQGQGRTAILTERLV